MDWGEGVVLRVEGADAVALDGAGLRLNTAAGDLTLPLLVADRSNAQRANVARLDAQAFDVIAPFALMHANAQAGAGLRYATFLGGGGTDHGYDIAVVGAGQAYVTGETESADFPASLGPGYDTTYKGNWDVFIVKLDAAGAALRYATFLGGGGTDHGNDIAVDSVGQTYVTGSTASADFPASLGPGYDTSYNGGSDAFVVMLNAAGAALLVWLPLIMR